jgi:hypothetical protein
MKENTSRTKSEKKKKFKDQKQNFEKL